MFIDAYLALCAAVGAGSCTEASGTGYARQPISFSVPQNGVSVSTRPYSFGFPSLNEPVAGRAIFDAPTGGNLLLVLPHATARPIPPPDQADAGFISLVFAALQSLANGAAYAGTIAAGATAGVCYDELEVLGRAAMVSGGNLVPTQVNSSPMTAGVALTIVRGTLMASSAWPI